MKEYGGDYPPLLRRPNETYWFLRHVYAKCEPPVNSHWSAIVCNESGKGKSYLSMGVAWPQYPDFDPNESIAFTAEDFVKIAAQKHPRHFPLILDDAGLSAFSGDALTLKVKRLSKIAQSIRHKHWQIILNLPSFELMAKSVKITNHYYLEPVWIDYDNKITHAKFQRLRIHPFSGQLKRMNMVRKMVIPNEVTGYNDFLAKKVLTVQVPKVPDTIARQYENLQSEFKQRFADETHMETLVEKRKELNKAKPSSFEIEEAIQKNLSKFQDKEGRADWSLISKEFGVSNSSAINMARKINRLNGVLVNYRRRVYP